MIHVSPWTVVLICVSLVVAALVAGVAITRARRLDRLHQRILASRDALSRLLLRRAFTTAAASCLGSGTAGSRGGS